MYHQQSTVDYANTSSNFYTNVILLYSNPRDWYSIMYSKLTTSTSTPSPPFSSPPTERLSLPHPPHRALNTCPP